jgi:hypothetical protein
MGFVREENSEIERKSYWQNGKLIKWLEDGDSDDDETLMTSRVVAKHL